MHIYTDCVVSSASHSKTIWRYGDYYKMYSTLDRRRERMERERKKEEKHVAKCNIKQNNTRYSQEMPN